MLTFRPRIKDATVLFVRGTVATGFTSYERTFRLEERLAPDAAVFLEAVTRVHVACPDLVSASKFKRAALRHVLYQPTDGGGPVTDEQLDQLVPSVEVRLLNRQGILYGFRGESKLGNRLAPILRIIYKDQALSIGANLSTPLQELTESVHAESGLPTPTES